MSDQFAVLQTDIDRVKASVASMQTRLQGVIDQIAQHPAAPDLTPQLNELTSIADSLDAFNPMPTPAPAPTNPNQSPAAPTGG